jgi:hypothetical protein
MSPKRPSLLSFLIVALAFLATCAYEGLSPKRDEQKSKEIERQWADLPVYPDMVPTSSSSSSGGRNAYKGTSFRSSAPYEDVKRFYMDRLGGHGWVFEKEKRLSEWGVDRGGSELKWRKGEYVLSIEYAGNDNRDWDYGIDISWYEK